ncbi:RDD family protein [Erysipelotrichaceae bacterium HCN-30851]
MKVKSKTPAGKKSYQLVVDGVRPLTVHDCKERLLSFCMDLCVMLSPIAIWNVILLAVLGSILSISGMRLITLFIGVLLVISILFFNSYVYQLTGGQSIGMRMFQFKVVKKSGKKASRQQLIVREVIGFAIPFIILMFFTNIFGVAVYWMLNGLFILVDKRCRSIIDVFTGTRVVKIEPKQKPKEEVATVAKEEKQNDLPINSMDLHIHSNFSDKGQFNVEEIFQYAKCNNIKTISITDLDCAKANSVAQRMSELYGVRYIPGIEINCDLHGKRVRVLGYFIQYNSELFAHIENESLVNEKRASIDRVRRFSALLGRNIDEERLLKNNRFQRISGELIAKHVLNRPEYFDCPLLKPYLHDEYGWKALNKDYFVYGKPCYVPVKYPRLQDILDVIELTGGISVIAHPGKLLSYDPDLLDEVLDMGVQGIEVFHPMHTKKEMAELLKIATNNKLLVSAGSGFYNMEGSSRIGKCNCPEEGESLVELMLQAKM